MRACVHACVRMCVCVAKPVAVELRCHATALMIRSFSYLQVSRTSIISWTSSNFSQIRSRTAELAAFEHLKKFP